MLIGRHDVDNQMRRDPASTFLPTSIAHPNADNHIVDAETDGVALEICEFLMKLRPIKQESLIRDNNKLILLASLSDSLEYIADFIEKFGNASAKPSEQTENVVKTTYVLHKRSDSLPPKDLPSFAEDYRKLAIDFLKVLRVEMQLEAVFNIQFASQLLFYSLASTSSIQESALTNLKCRMEIEILIQKPSPTPPQQPAPPSHLHLLATHHSPFSLATASTFLADDSTALATPHQPLIQMLLNT